MSLLKRISVWGVNGDERENVPWGYGFWCHGCREMHRIPVEGPNGWTFNGSQEKPTFTPSVLIRWRAGDRGDKQYESTCHLFVMNGEIQFLPDCTHEYAGKTVAMLDLRDDVD